MWREDTRIRTSSAGNGSGSGLSFRQEGIIVNGGWNCYTYYQNCNHDTMRTEDVTGGMEWFVVVDSSNRFAEAENNPLSLLPTRPPPPKIED